jgi:hypothetical protein
MGSPKVGRLQLERTPSLALAPAPPFATRSQVLTAALLAAAGLFVVWLFSQILMFRYGRDQGIYATVAAAMLRGGMPYRDAWDFKPPGIYVIYALSRAVLGPGQWAIRSFEVIGLAGLVCGFIVLSRRFFASAAVGLIGGALAVLVHAELEFWHTAQPESFGGMLTVFALVLATFEPADEDPRRRAKLFGAWAAAGALYGGAFLLKPPLGGGALVSAAFAAVRIYRRPFDESRDGRTTTTVAELAMPFFAMAAGSAAIIAAFVAWFLARGAFSDLVQTMFVFTPEYTKLSWEDATWPGMLYLSLEEWLFFFSSGNAAGILAAVILGPLAAREREGILHVLLVIAVQLVGVTMQGKFFPYHYGASLLLGSLVAGLGVFKLWEHALAKGWLGVLAFAALLPFVLFARSATRDTETDFLDRAWVRQRALFSDQSMDELNGKLYSVADVSYGADQSVAAYLHDHLTPKELVYIWGFEPMIYDISERVPASRYIYNVPQRVAWYRDRARSELMADLARHPPRAVVVEHRDVFPAVTGETIDSADSLRSFPALSTWLADHYEFATAIEDFDIYLSK